MSAPLPPTPPTARSAGWSGATGCDACCGSGTRSSSPGHASQSLLTFPRVGSNQFPPSPATCDWPCAFWRKARPSPSPPSPPWRSASKRTPRIFMLADATLLHPVQLREPGQLVVWSWTSAYPDYQEYTKRTDVFQGVAAIGGGGRVNLVIDGSSELARTSFVTGQTLDVLGAGPSIAGQSCRPMTSRTGRWSQCSVTTMADAVCWRSVRHRPHLPRQRPAPDRRGRPRERFRGISLSANTALYLPTGTYNQVETGFSRA